MALPGEWIGIDIIGTQLGGEVFVHSFAGERVARPLQRVRQKLGYDHKGEQVVSAVVSAKLEGRELPAIPGLHVETHQIDGSDGTPIGLICWIASTPPTKERPTYNGWVLDMTAMTTRTSGDDPSLIGDGREADEERHVQYLFTYLCPEDAWSMCGGYYDALTGDDGLLIDSYWSLNPPEAHQWTHMWSSCRLRVSEADQRTLYGLTMVLKERKDFQTNIATLVRFTQATMLLVEKKNRIPLTTVGRMAPLGESRVAQILDQVDLDHLGSPDSSEGADQPVTIDGQPFTATKFALHSAQDKHGDPVAIILLTEETAAA
ncbi:hypothetical protein [Nocardia vermiculata]|uniref:Rv3651-like N-terminal domain-containing protein n=1 Tax=Nocardia vermiculata TaxID=257274 RepID=A0A846Y813_9NOCA|nr:hypothetical protein [Nocardia vermiculata]NKY53944.1 hypothetical protein [Nocardia vermiculata]